MSQKLSTITPTYHAFAKDQLLSHTDLNEVIDYFEDQDRLSRICLSGVGIVCGFKPTLVTGGQDPVLHISQGSGVTTDGDLIHFLFDVDGNNSIVDNENVDPAPNKITDYLKLTKFRTFTDSNANYGPFDSGSGQITLQELVPQTASSGLPLTEALFENRTLILYLDCYSKEPGACTTISCDSQGIEQVRVLRVLLVDDADLDVLNENDYLFNANDIAQEYLSLLNVGTERVIVNDTNTDNVADLSDAYEAAVLSSGMLSNLTASLQIIGSHVEYNWADLNSAINSALNGTFTSTLFQYRYDLFRDLVDSYQELRRLFIEVYPSCCPDIHPFPKHLLIGTINEVENEDDVATVADLWEENNVNRHKFYPSPIITHHYSAREHLLSILDRMKEMVEQYSVSTALSTDEIRITPSNMDHPLGERAIPFYYDPQYDSNSNSRLVRLWDFNRNTLRQYDDILGYNQADEISNPLVSQPLQYNLNAFDFFRIEGHQGLLYQDALERVNQIRDQFALGFDTKVLGISVDASQTIDIDDYTCDFADLQGQLETCKDVQNCLFEFASQLLSGYSIDPIQEGFNHNTAELMGRQKIFVVSPNFEFILIDDGSSDAPSSGSSPSSQASQSQQEVATRQADGSQTYSSSNPKTTKQTGASSGESFPAAQMNMAALELQAQLALVGLNLADVDNPIVKNLYTEDNGLGSIVLDAFQRYIGTDSETTYQYMEFQIDNLVAPGAPLANWNNDVQQGNLYMPAKILSSAYAASLMIPETLNALTPDLIANYQSEVDRLCSYIRQYQSSYETLRAGQNTSISNDLYALSELLSGNMATLCCAGDKLQSILDQIDARKLEILTGLELAQFAEEHPGMEHMAGVPKGGTFIMAYAFNETGSGAIQDGTVIADFALPYLCCSDCRPVNFIVPKNVVSLLLSSSVICIDPTSAEPITVSTTVTPGNGIVDILTPVEGVSIVDNEIVVTPVDFDTNALNTPIEFTVNGQFTNATLTVVEPATVGISTTPPIPTAETEITSFVFYATGYGPDDTIIWDFGDGTTANGPVVSHTYQLPLSGNEATIRLTVIPPSGACPATSSVQIKFKEVSVSLDQTDFCEDDAPYPFTIVPAGASPNITGTGVSADQKFFDPSLTPGEGSYTMFVDGNEFAIANVFPKPIAEIVASANQTDRILILDSTLENVDQESVRWAFFDPVNPDVELQQPAPVQGQPRINVSYSEIGEPNTTRLIRLTASAVSGSPCSAVADEISFTVPEQ